MVPERLDLREGEGVLDGHAFEPAFSEDLARYHGSGLVHFADFKNQYRAERVKVNRWVEEQTRGRIQEMVPDLTPKQAERVRMMLASGRRTADLVR